MNNASSAWQFPLPAGRSISPTSAPVPGISSTTTRSRTTSSSRLRSAMPASVEPRSASIHLAPHTTFDLSLGKSFGENWSVRLTGLNLSNHHYLLDNANSFGGTHFANPRQLSIQLKYRFRY